MILHLIHIYSSSREENITLKFIYTIQDDRLFDSPIKPPLTRDSIDSRIEPVIKEKNKKFFIVFSVMVFIVN